MYRPHSPLPFEKSAPARTLPIVGRGAVAEARENLDAKGQKTGWRRRELNHPLAGAY